GGAPPVVTATVMGTAPPPPPMMMQQQPVPGTMIAPGAPPAPYGGGYGAPAPPPYQQPAPYGYQAQQGYTAGGAVPMAAGPYGGQQYQQQMYGNQPVGAPM
ncbi:Acidic proline-rich protein PRP25 precursor, putative, partial [Perkinsus marinus ATCC 50983]